MLLLLLATSSCLIIHLLGMAWTARCFGITVREVSVGMGPTIVQGNGFRLGLVPIGGYVRYRSVHEEDVPADEVRTTLESAPLIKQITVAVAGCVLLLALAFALIGSQALSAFLNTPEQVVTGVISPFGTAQKLLLESGIFLREASAGSILGVVAAKYAALNLLPFPVLNGGFILANLGRASGIARIWPRAATIVLVFVLFGLCALWIFALIVRVSGI